MWLEHKFYILQIKASSKFRIGRSRNCWKKSCSTLKTLYVQNFYLKMKYLPSFFNCLVFYWHNSHCVCCYLASLTQNIYMINLCLIRRSLNLSLDTSLTKILYNIYKYLIFIDVQHLQDTQGYSHFADIICKRFGPGKLILLG